MEKEFDIDSLIDKFLEDINEVEEDDDYPTMIIDTIWF